MRMESDIVRENWDKYLRKNVSSLQNYTDEKLFKGKSPAKKFTHTDKSCYSSNHRYWHDINKDPNFYIKRVFWNIIFSHEEWNDMEMDRFNDPDYGIFDWDTNYKIVIGGNTTYKGYIFSNAVMCSLFYGKCQCITEKTKDKVILTISIFFDAFHNGNILPCVPYHDIHCSLEIIYKKTIPKNVRDKLHKKHSIEFNYLYYQHKPGLLQNFSDNYNCGSKRIIQLQFTGSEKLLNLHYGNDDTLKEFYTKTKLNFWNSCCNIFISFRKNDKFIDIGLKKIRLQFNGFDSIVINNPSRIYGNSNQFSKTTNEKNPILFQNATRPLFPIEVWVNIIKFLNLNHDKNSLSYTSKSLWNINQLSLLKKQHVHFIEGWYCIPFFSESIISYSLMKSINMSMINNATMSLIYKKCIENVDCYIFTTSYNILMSENGMMYTPNGF